MGLFILASAISVKVRRHTRLGCDFGSSSCCDWLHLGSSNACQCRYWIWWQIHVTPSILFILVIVMCKPIILCIPPPVCWCGRCRCCLVCMEKRVWEWCNWQRCRRFHRWSCPRRWTKYVSETIWKPFWFRLAGLSKGSEPCDSVLPLSIIALKTGRRRNRKQKTKMHAGLYSLNTRGITCVVCYRGTFRRSCHMISNPLFWCQWIYCPPVQHQIK